MATTSNNEDYSNMVLNEDLQDEITLDQKIQIAENQLKALKMRRKRKRDEELRQQQPDLPRRINAKIINDGSEHGKLQVTVIKLNSKITIEHDLNLLTTAIEAATSDGHLPVDYKFNEDKKIVHEFV